MKVITACGLLVLLQGCATTGLRTSNGGGFISDFSEGETVGSHVEVTKRGEACSTNILGIYASGDASIEAAKKNGGITRVATVDTKIFAVRPFYGKVCTIVSGS